jgi:hypothetical protein
VTEGPDPEAILRYCREVLPGMLIDVCGVAIEAAERVAQDVLARAEALCRLDYRRQEIIAAPFFEESFDHEPADAPLWTKAITTVIIRNGLLEELHADGPVESGGIQGITTYGLGPVSHLRAARRLNAITLPASQDIFGSLADRYPRAWACLDRLRGLLNEGGGRLGYRPPDAAVPVLPDPEELVKAPAASSVEVPSDKVQAVIFSAIDPRFDQSAYSVLKAALEGPGLIVGFSALSRISRNSDKLLRVLEFLLAHEARVLTTNYLLADGEVWVRKKELVKPDSHDWLAGWKVSKGLSGAHRKTVDTYLEMVGVDAG